MTEASLIVVSDADNRADDDDDIVDVEERRLVSEGVADAVAACRSLVRHTPVSYTLPTVKGCKIVDA